MNKFIKLTDEFDNYIIVSVKEIQSFRMCELSNLNLGVEITFRNGNKQVVVEPLSKFKQLLEIRE